MAARTLDRQALSGVEVAPMRRHHLRRVLAIESRVYPRPWTASLFAAELEQPESRRYFVALAGAGWAPWRAVVGYAGVLLQVDDAHITTVAVDPGHHRRKVGTHLMLALMRAARDLGAQSATLEVRAANRGAQRLYTAFGFAPVGLRPGYYTDTNEDAVIMWAHDLPSDEIAARLDRQEARLRAPGGASGAPDEPVPWVRGRKGLPKRGT